MNFAVNRAVAALLTGLLVCHGALAQNVPTKVEDEPVASKPGLLRVEDADLVAAVRPLTARVLAAGMAGWILWPQLDDRSKLAIARLVEHEADRFIFQPPKSSRFRDTGAEENAWNSLVLSLASNMMPEHPRAKLWDRAALDWLVRIQQQQEGYYNVRRDLEYGGLCATRLIACCLGHPLLGEGAKPLSQSEFDRRVGSARSVRSGRRRRRLSDRQPLVPRLF